MFSLFKQSIKTDDYAEVCWNGILKSRQWYIEEVIGDTEEKDHRLLNEPDEFVYMLFFIDDWCFTSQMVDEKVLKSFRKHFYPYIWKYADEHKCSSMAWGKWLIEHLVWQPPDSSFDNKTPRENLNRRLLLYTETIEQRDIDRNEHEYNCTRLCLALSGNINLVNRIQTRYHFSNKWKFHKDSISKFKIKLP
jgi:hypothetical protein